MVRGQSHLGRSLDGSHLLNWAAGGSRIPVVSLEDVYGGKLVAAMDRQHPHDLFDVMQLFAHEGTTAGIRRAFVVYLASHNRPVLLGISHLEQLPGPRWN